MNDKNQDKNKNYYDYSKYKRKENSIENENKFTNHPKYEYKSETYGIFGTEDTVVNDREEFKKTWWKRNYHEDVFGHRMTEDVFIETVKPIIETIRKAVS